MIDKPFITKRLRDKDYLEVMHANVYRPFNVHVHGGHEYFITFIDDYSRYGYFYLMHMKFDVLDKFKKFKVELKKYLLGTSNYSIPWPRTT